MLFLISILLVLAFSLLLGACLKLKNRAAYILCLYILATANIIVCGLLASFFSQMNSVYFYLACQTMLFLAAYLVWFFQKKPALSGAWQDKVHIPGKVWLRYSWRFWKINWIFAVIVALFYILGAWLILNVPPNTNDALTTHLARIGFWLQHGNMLPWTTSNLFMLIYPVNANLVMLWSMLFTQSAAFTGFVQWSAALAGAVAVYGISRLLGWKRAPSVFAGLVWLGLPEILLQSTTSQLDLVVAVFFVIAVYFLLLGVKEGSMSCAILSALAFGISLGTKQIVLFTIPGLVIFLILIWLKDRKNSGKYLLIWAGLTVGFSLLLGSYIYIQNTSLFGNPLGNESTLSQQTSGSDPAQWKDNLFFNSTRLFYQSLDPTGMPPVFVDNLVDFKTRILRPLFGALGMDLESETALGMPQNRFQYSSIPPIQEDRAWYGLLGVLLLLPLSVVQLISGIRKRNPIGPGLVFLAFSFSLCVILIRPGWTPNQGRYFIIPVTLMAPFVASIVRKDLAWKILDWAIVILTAVTMFNTTVSNVGKPLLAYRDLQVWLKPYAAKWGQANTERVNALLQYSFPSEKTIFDLDRTSRQLIQSGMSVKPVKFVNQFVPADMVLAIQIPSSYSLFPFFGENLRRKLFPIESSEALPNQQWFLENQIQYLLIYQNSRDGSPLPSWLIPYQASGDWVIYKVTW